MSKSEKDYNEGQKDGSKSTGLDRWIQQFNPFTSSDYNKGYEHGAENRPKSSDSSSDSSNSSSSSDKSSSSKSCLVSSACVEAMSLSDNCFELNTLRKFRDSYLINIPNGNSEINNYYQIAPTIVNKIYQLQNPMEYLKITYHSLVLPCVRLIIEGKNEEAFSHYKREILRNKSVL